VGLVLVGAVSLLIYLVLNAYAPQLRSNESGGGNVLSKSAIGFAGIRRLLNDTGVDVVPGREPPASGRFSLVVLTPELLVSSESKLADLSALGQRLVVLPKWMTMPDREHSGWVVNLGLAGKGAVKELIAKFAKDAVITQDSGIVRTRLTARYEQFDDASKERQISVDQLQTISGKGLEFDVVDDQGRALLAHVPGTQIFILSDPDLLNNLGLGNRDVARVALAMIHSVRVGDKPVSFDITLNGFGTSPNILHAVFSPPLLGATLCAILAAAFLAFHAFHRFGPETRPERVFAFGKRALADNTAAVIRLMRREARMAPRYAQVTLNIVASDVGQSRDRHGNLAWLGPLEQRAGVEHRFADLKAEAAAVDDVLGLLRVAQRLYRWRVGVLHEHR
jgi:hypothetical protein